MAKRVQKIKRYREDADKQYDTITDGEHRRLVNEGVDKQHKAPKPKSNEELDELIDEIDELLETNAEEFVKNYVQKGGE